jgi:ribonucleoside-diphosphate reductase alpha chain
MKKDSKVLCFDKVISCDSKEIDWIKRDVEIKNEKGEVIFEQKDIEAPVKWSQTAVQIVASKYFREIDGVLENSIDDMVDRIVCEVGTWGIEQKYFKISDMPSQINFKEELRAILLNQMAAFNSPVYFSLGVKKKPQTSACFITSVNDTMDSIMELFATDAKIFKGGSGNGVNISRLRGKGEKLSTGGTSSGPVSFMDAMDVSAGAVKSGGALRRSSKLVCMDDDHPDILEFIQAKSKQEEMGHSLMECGYDGGLDGDIISTIRFQNANHSVRLSDEFFHAVENDKKWYTVNRKGGGENEYNARDILLEIAKATWYTGDPGVQYSTTINNWNTCPNSGDIRSSNPCLAGDTMISTSKGDIRIKDLCEKPFEVVGGDGELHEVPPAFCTGVKSVYKLKTKSGFSVCLTEGHRVFTSNRGDVAAKDLTKEDNIPLGKPRHGKEVFNEGLLEYVGALVGDGCINHSIVKGRNQSVILTLSPKYEKIIYRFRDRLMEYKLEKSKTGFVQKINVRKIKGATWEGSFVLRSGAKCIVDMVEQFAVLDKGSSEKCFTQDVFRLDKKSVTSILRGLFTTDGTVANYSDKSNYVSYDSTSIKLLEQVQLLLLRFGIKSKIYVDRRNGKTSSMLPDGKGGMKEYSVKDYHSLRISRSSRVVFEKEIGFVEDSYKNDKLFELNKNVSTYLDKFEDQFESLEYIGEEPVYNLTEKETHHYVANGLSVRNCSEFLFLDDSACNLASINLAKFWSLEKGFDLKKLEQTIRVMITAQDILIDGSSYPTEKIKLNSRIFRPLGLGFTNLGGLLMRMGIAYDSKEGRNVASFLTSFITGNAYLQSARLARVLGPFKMYEINKKYVMEVLREHDEYNYTILEGKHYELSIIKDLWGRVIDEAGRNGMRNSQVTVIAPTGTISFMMDADTTGCEPEFSLVKYKKLVGGGTLKIVNESVEPGLRALGYYDRYVKEILDHVHENGTVEGSPIDPEHLSVFDCSLKSENGSRFISPLAHLEMLEAIQPYISGGISKTVNVQTDTTVDEIYDLYIEGYKMGLKSIAIYRDGSKITQPLSVKKKEKNLTVEKEEKNLKRRRLSSERGSITHKFNIGGSSGYITAGLFDNGELGEIFINVNKAGSTIGGLLDSFAILTSISLQHGVELEVLVKKFEGTRFLPDGWTGNQDIPVASSILDYVFRWLKAKFLSEKELKESLPAKQTDVFVESENPSCAFCSGSTIRSGTCFVCETCGSTTGCG